MFSPGNIFDIPENYYMGMRILSGDNPYLVEYPNNWVSSKLPPLNFIVYSIFIFLFGESIFTIHLVAVFFDILIIIVIYQLVRHIWDEKKAFIAVTLYSLSPFTIFMLILGQNDFIVTFFLIITIYYYIIDKKKKSAIFLGLGILTKYIPIFLCIAIFIELYYKNKSENKLKKFNLIKDLIGFFSITTLVIILIVIPFILSDFWGVINQLFSFLSYNSRSMSYSYLFNILIEYKISIFGLISLNLLNILEIFSFSIIIFYYLRKKKEFSKIDLLKIVTFFYTVFNLFSMNFTSRNLFWIFPLLNILIINSGLKISEKKDGNSQENDLNKRDSYWKFLILYNLLIIMSLIVIIFIIYLKFEVLFSDNPLILVNLNWSINPEASTAMRQYFQILMIPVIIIILMSPILYRFFNLKTSIKRLQYLILIWAINPWIYYIFFGLFYVNFFIYLELSSINFIISIISIFGGILIGIYIIIFFFNEISSKKIKFSKINYSFSKLIYNTRNFIFSSKNIEFNSEPSKYLLKKDKKDIFRNLPKKSMGFIKIIMIPILLRIILMFLPFNPGDHEILFYSGQSILNGYIPYRDFGLGGNIFPGGYEHPHPPVFHYLQIIPVLLSGCRIEFSFLSYKLYYLILELLTIYFIYKILIKIWNLNKIKIFFIYYGVCPSVFYSLGFIGMQEITTSLFIAGGIYYYLESRYGISAILFGIGFMDSLFPIFIFLFLVLYLIKLKNIKQVFLYIFTFLTVCLVISLPFLIICFEEYINFIKLTFSYDTTFSFDSYFISDSLFELVLINISILKFQIQIKHLYMLLILVFIILYTNKVLKYKKNYGIYNTYLDIFMILSVFMVFVPIMFRSVHFRLIYWAFPYIYIYLMSNITISESETIKTQNNLIRSSIILFIFEIFFAISWFTLQIDYLNRAEYYHQTFLWFLFFQTIWILSMLISKLKRNYKLTPFIKLKLFLSLYIYFQFICTFIIFEITLEKTSFIFGYITPFILLGCVIISLIIIRKTNSD